MFSVCSPVSRRYDALDKAGHTRGAILATLTHMARAAIDSVDWVDGD